MNSPRCKDGISSTANPTHFAKVGRVLNRSANRECSTSLAAVRPQKMAVLIQKKVGARAGSPVQVASSTQVGK